MILPQEPEEGLYICINNDSDCLKPLEDENKKIVIGTPLLFMKKLIRMNICFGMLQVII